MLKEDIELIRQLLINNRYNLKLDRDFSEYEDILCEIEDEYDYLQENFNELKEDVSNIKHEYWELERRMYPLC